MARILFIEDEPWLGELYVGLLGTQHDVVWVRDGYEAMAQVDRQQPDLIVLDLMLPWVNGLQLLHELVGYEDTARIPVVLFSAALPEQLDDRMLQAYGVVTALDKLAVKPQKVLQIIQGIVTAYAEHSH